MFLPRVGHEVLVTFLEGDPDQPMVVGRVHNSEARPTWVLPAGKTRSGFRTRTCKGGAANFNELSFDDKQGAEEVFIQAERDKVGRIKHDSFADIGNERHVTVHKDAFEEVKGDAHLKVVGDLNNEAGGSLSFKVGQDSQTKAGQKFAVDAGTEIHLKAGMKVVLEAGASLSLKVGGNFITINPAGVFIKGAMVMLNSGGDGGSGSGAAPIAPKPPKAARSSAGGTDAAPIRPPAPAAPSPQAASLKLAWKAAAPFCAQCEAAKQEQGA
jgi:type VI secretion system secreted protein VgrG